MNKTALFLILLIAPLTFCQSEVLELIDKTPEGKEVIDTLFVQMKLMGSQLDSATVKNLFSTMEKAAEDEKKNTLAKFGPFADACDQDKKTLGQLAADHVEKEFGIKRSLENAKRVFDAKKVNLDRTDEEYDNYNKFKLINDDNKERGLKHLKDELENLKVVKGNLEKIKDIVKGKPEEEAASFVQLGERYHMVLAEVKTDVENLKNDSTGLQPIISNLVEIMQDANASMKPEVRVSIRGIINNLKEKVRDRIDQVEEELIQITETFDRLGQAFDANVKRGKDAKEQLKKILEKLTDKIDSLQKGHEHAVSLTEKVKSIMALRMKECRLYKETLQFANVREEKVKAAVGEAKGVFATHENGFGAYFIQRSSKKLN
jgi:hypothetical protein